MNDTSDTSVLKVKTNDCSFDNNNVRSREYDDIFFQKDGIDESKYVFFDQNNIQEKFDKLKPNSSFTIGEIGFGLGLNFLIAIKKWKKSNNVNKNTELNYIAFDKFVIDEEILRNLSLIYPDIKPEAEILIKNMQPLKSGINFINIFELNLKLIFFVGDISEQLNLAKTLLNTKIDSWFFDGFDPKKNPEMWSKKIFIDALHLSSNEASFSTYTSSGVVKKSLADLGIQFNKVKGFGKKRHMLTGIFPKKLFPNIKNNSSLRIAIIGSGLSGSITANKLAKNNNFKVTVFDSQESRASSSPNAAMYPKLALGSDTRSQFVFQSYFYAASYYSENIPEFNNEGIIFLSSNENKKDWINRFIKFNRNDIAHKISKNEIHELTGIEQDYSGLKFNIGGCLSPNKVCKHHLMHKNIEYKNNFYFESFEVNDHNKININFLNKESEDNYDYLILALGSGIKKFIPSLNILKGSLIALKNNRFKKVKIPINHSGYILPVMDGFSWIGSSHQKNVPTINQEDSDEEILNNLNSVINTDISSNEVIKRWSGDRITTPNKLPICGTYKNHNNVFLIGGLGSRGLSYAPALAEHINCMIRNKQTIFTRNIEEAISPNRFKDLS